MLAALLLSCVLGCPDHGGPAVVQIGPGPLSASSASALPRKKSSRRSRLPRKGFPVPGEEEDDSSSNERPRPWTISLLDRPPLSESIGKPPECARDAHASGPRYLRLLILLI